MTHNNELRLAERPSTCPDCFSFINIGDQVMRRNVFEEQRHARCPKTKFDFDPDDVCSSCFTVRSTNGKCAC